MFDFFKPSSKVAYTDWGILVLRVCVPLLLLTHGYDKLLSFLNGAADFPDPLHVGPRISHALAVIGEVIAPLLVIIGLWTRVAAVIEIIHFLVVAFIMHAGEPLGEKEHGLLFLIAYVTILLIGAGKYSLDRSLYQKRRF
ncbi:DoxX family protein [Runella slithyformis]|uniref:DoxX family protein n=1 Tax=Runella slithyformis (strain ATCC 29530 / DSM 19594 / LMG 11500 / NCIMB 11436 / LSU 4) TaxID=761193 RepID=A0A7U3ZQW3_RUNSL|nr:DoxX family protein [Runella slithyformis]AEI51715.1 DoxX family protein [Runella slithyformis DSM 19594]